MGSDLSAPPPGWRMVRDDAGACRLSRPTFLRACVCALLWFVSAVALYVWLREPTREAGTAALVGMLLFAAAWVTWAREEWVVQPGRMAHRLQFGPFVRESRFENGRFEVSSKTDSEWNWYHRLIVRDDAKSRIFDSSAHDEAGLMYTAHWLAAVTGFRIDGRDSALSRRTPEGAEADG